jgi:hypothetical protein
VRQVGYLLELYRYAARSTKYKISVRLIWTSDQPDAQTSTCITHNTHDRQTDRQTCDGASASHLPAHFLSFSVPLLSHFRKIFPVTVNYSVSVSHLPLLSTGNSQHLESHFMRNHLELLISSAPAIIKLATFVPFAFAVALCPGSPADTEYIGKAQPEGS